MFRSRRRPVVFPQAEHARLAAALAAEWGNDEVAAPRLPRERFVRGVALHDRGYGELDADGIGEVGAERWVEIQRRSFAPRGQDPLVDLVVALHVHRLLSRPREPVEAAALPELEAALPGLREAVGVSEADAAAADLITNVCDAVSFAWCLEEPDEGSVRGFDYAVNGHGGIELSPWPLAVPRLSGIVAGFEADGYPERLEPVVGTFRARPQ